VLQRVAACCSVLQRVAACLVYVCLSRHTYTEHVLVYVCLSRQTYTEHATHTATHMRYVLCKSVFLFCLAYVCRAYDMQMSSRTATGDCNALQRTLQHATTHTATHCNARCNTLQRTMQYTSTHATTHCNAHCNTLQHTLQHTATHTATGACCV